MRAGAGQSDVGGVDADAIEQVQDAQLLIDRRRADRRRLQSVAQRFVVEQNDRRLGRRRLEVPVEDQIIHDATSSMSALTDCVRAQPDQPGHGDAAAPRDTSRSDARLAGPITSSTVTPRTLSGQRGTLRGDIAAHTGTGLAILHDAERDRRQQGRPARQGVPPLNYRVR